MIHLSCSHSSFEPSTHHLGHPDHTGIHHCILAGRNLLGRIHVEAAAAVEGSRMIHRKPAVMAERVVPRNPADEL